MKKPALFQKIFLCLVITFLSMMLTRPADAQPAQPAATAEIHAVQFTTGETNCDITIKGKGDLRYTASFLEDPMRIELWFINAAFKLQEPIPAYENPFVQEIIAASVTSLTSDKTAKVTIELKAKFQYAIEGIPDGVVLHLYGIQNGNVNSAPENGETGNGQSARASNSNEVLIGPEDLLEISVFQLPEFSLTTRVLADGTITMPLVGSIKLAGLSRAEAEATISQALTLKQVNRPSVSITIREYKSRQVSVLGSVKTAGIYYLTSSRTLLQLLSEAGGLTEDAGTKCFIFRGGSKLLIDLHDLMQNGNQQLNILIQPGDVVNVPSLTRAFVYVLGAVRSPGAVEMIPSVGLTLAGAIARAGGPTRLADLSDIQIKRKDETGVERVIRVNLKDILNNKVPDVTLFADDLINVTESFF
jgi:polysaccharide biosynthesis/export protein